MNASLPLQLALAAYHGFARGDMHPLFAMLAEDIVWTNHSSSPYSPFAGVHYGIEGVKSYFSHMPEIDQERFAIQALAEQKGYVMVTIDRKATYLAADKIHEGQIAHVLHFEEGKLRRMDIYEHRYG